MTEPRPADQPAASNTTHDPTFGGPAAVYSPTPDPRPGWATPAWAAPADPPALQPTEPVARTEPDRGLRASPGVGPLVATALLSAVLASGGTVLVLQGTGALDRPAVAAPAASPGPQPVSIDESSAVIDAAARVSPAVVRITATGTITDPAGGTIPEQGVGSGVIYDPAGWILTNRHVVRTADGSIASHLTVELKDGREFAGTVYGIDTLTDLAIVKVEASGLPAAPIGRSAELKVGQLAIAIGSPLGTYTSTVTTGIVSATGRTVVVDPTLRLTNLIQTDAAINPGNSGGPLLDAAGQVVGINTAVERGSTGIGFAIPIDIARPIMAQALAGEELARPYVGIRYQQIDVKLKQAKNLPVDRGALIGPSTNASGVTEPAINPGSPAEAAGLKDGDIVTAIEDQAIDTEHPLDAVLTSYAPGQTVKMTVLRGGTSMTISVTLGTRPEGL
jgi:S1-C subfamily serine protease